MMSDYEVLLRHLDREIRARKEAEEISEKKISELYRFAQRLEESLKAQKEISKKLKEKTKALKQQIAKTEEERHAKSTLQTILESAIEYSIIAINLKGVILVWNEGARRNYGYEAQELVNKESIEILHTVEDIQSGKVRKFFQTVRREGKAEEIFQRVRKDGSQFTASVTMTIRHDSQGKKVGYVIISKDITEIKEFEEKLIKSNQDLEEFSYIISHDLKAPLRAIIQLATWIEEDCGNKLDPLSRKNLQLLRERTRRMSGMIDGLLQYARAGRVNMEVEWVDTKELIQEIIDILNHDEQFAIIIHGSMPQLPTAKLLLSQVFSNLIANSMKHHHCKTGTIEIGVLDKGTFYEFFVADDGPGIEPVYFEKIFRIFQTLKSKDEAETTGIGLTIVKKIVESQNGKIEVDSELGKGARFSFTWPKAPHQ
ncbi:TPA: PAS domain S-box protein [Legionella pneumophila subsp. pneumophila]|nr:PAS domain S-box protein [Legionella pneumophila]HAT8683826.1 PAS domain S-box protein [Legionella pneumophila subsp. pneumophila ATCC 43283]HAT8883459.1 PAS domain S-box protein [Legionella pneumophila subsp. pneumophila]HAT8892964.1 PAS domain S-box protein [Legionella pneumophila subsp. pneumophila]HAT8905084.1 PAS domain S-box protein [Legionella pneumophila subsp. pneumophila]